MAKENIETFEKKRFYWIKLKENFFEDRHVRVIRARENGYRILTIYLMLQLRGLQSNGIIEYAGILERYTLEIASDIGESETAVIEALEVLCKCGLVEICAEKNVCMVPKQELIDVGSESESAKRVREHRARKGALEQIERSR